MDRFTGGLPLRQRPNCGVGTPIPGRPLSLSRLPQASWALFHASAVFPRDAVTIDGETRDYAGRFFCPRCGSSIFARTADEIEVNLGSLDAPDQLMPTYESWIVRRESWLPPFPLTRRYERDRDANGSLLSAKSSLQSRRCKCPNPTERVERLSAGLRGFSRRPARRPSRRGTLPRFTQAVHGARAAPARPPP